MKNEVWTIFNIVMAGLCLLKSICGTLASLEISLSEKQSGCRRVPIPFCPQGLRRLPFKNSVTLHSVFSAAAAAAAPAHNDYGRNDFDNGIIH